ncbi:hypothetical protein GY45DRAFT_78455 [Cubamyces sp. BRFM 1775]|nr:hypothetical protein GY45DRAFT_78455 [Cubamyces sp. BRFM 1775]
MRTIHGRSILFGSELTYLHTDEDRAGIPRREQVVKTRRQSLSLPASVFLSRVVTFAFTGTRFALLRPDGSARLRTHTTHPDLPVSHPPFLRNAVIDLARSRLLTELKPCPIVSHVGWLGLPEGIWALEGLQSTFIPPPPPQPEKPKAGGMTLRKRKAPSATTSTSSTAASSATPAEEEVALRVSPRKRQRTTRAQAALAQAQEEQEAAAAAAVAAATAALEAAEAAAEVPASAAEEIPSSMLLDVPPPRANSNSRDNTKAVKQELLDVDGASSALLPLGLPLAVPDTAPALAAHEQPMQTTTSTSAESVASASPRTRSAASLSPSATRRSTRARRKPAQGPVQLSSSSLSSVSTASTPLSALSTPETSPAPLNARPLDDPESAHGKQQQQRMRAGSCGSSTAVSEAGEASEGTVVDLDDSASTAGPKKLGKRKAAEIEVENVGIDIDALVEQAQSAVGPEPLSSSDIAAATGPADANVTHATTASKKSGSRKSRAKAGSAARPKKRVKIDESAAAAATAAAPEASGEENVPPAPAPAPSSRPAKKSKAAAGSRARA